MKQFAVIGLGTFGINISKALIGKGCQVLAIDNNEGHVQEISGAVTRAIIADATDERALKSLGIQDMDGAIVSIGENMEASVLITLILKEMGVKMVVSKALSKLQAEVLRRVGADKIVFPERDTAERLADNLVSPNIVEEIALSPDYNIVEIVAPKEFSGKTLRELDIRARFKVNVIAIKRKTPVITDDGKTDLREETNITPEPDDVISEGDVIAVVGRVESINALKNR